MKDAKGMYFAVTILSAAVLAAGWFMVKMIQNEEENELKITILLSALCVLAVLYVLTVVKIFNHILPATVEGRVKLIKKFAKRTGIDECVSDKTYNDIADASFDSELWANKLAKMQGKSGNIVSYIKGIANSVDSILLYVICFSYPTICITEEEQIATKDEAFMDLYSKLEGNCPQNLDDAVKYIDRMYLTHFSDTEKTKKLFSLWQKEMAKKTNEPLLVVEKNPTMQSKSE